MEKGNNEGGKKEKRKVGNRDRIIEREQEINEERKQEINSERKYRITKKKE